MNASFKSRDLLEFESGYLPYLTFQSRYSVIQLFHWTGVLVPLTSDLPLPPSNMKYGT